MLMLHCYIKLSRKLLINVLLQLLYKKLAMLIKNIFIIIIEKKQYINFHMQKALKSIKWNIMELKTFRWYRKIAD